MKKIFILGAMVIASLSFAKSGLPTKAKVFKEFKEKSVIKTKAVVPITYVIDVPNKCGTISRVIFVADPEASVNSITPFTPFLSAAVDAMQLGYDNC